MKYKARRDIPKFAQEYNTISPTELARIVLKERHKERTSESISQWFKRHSEVHSQLVKLIETRSHKEAPKQIPEVIAKLVSDEYGTTEIINLETVETAKRRLALIENDIRTQICNQTKLQIIHRDFTQKIIQHKPRKTKRKRSNPSHDN